jgi:TolA-binding protein
MQFNGKKSLISAVILVATLPGISWAEEPEPLQQRVERLERIIQGQGLMNLITRVDQLQNEIKRLNGDNESLRHELEQMQKRQREMYLDLDQRMQEQTQAAPPQPVAPMTDDSVTEPELDSEIQTPVDGASEDAAPVAVENGEAAYQSALQILLPLCQYSLNNTPTAFICPMLITGRVKPNMFCGSLPMRLPCSRL